MGGPGPLWPSHGAGSGWSTAGLAASGYNTWGTFSKALDESVMNQNEFPTTLGTHKYGILTRLTSAEVTRLT